MLSLQLDFRYKNCGWHVNYLVTVEARGRRCLLTLCLTLCTSWLLEVRFLKVVSTNHFLVSNPVACSAEQQTQEV